VADRRFVFAALPKAGEKGEKVKRPQKDPDPITLIGAIKEHMLIDFHCW
jgi:hypothetical protein